MTTDIEPRILLVDDEPGLADLYAAWLADGYEVESVYTGSDALDHLDNTVDIVLLDRRMPGLSGDEVLDHIRDQELDCQVAMVTAVEPDFDIIDMGFDDYLLKPIQKDDLTALVEHLLTRAAYSDQLRENYRLVVKKSALEAERSDEELEANSDYIALIHRLEDIQERLERTIEDFDDDDFEAAFQGLADI